MASNQVLKKSFVGGFKKDGVLNYIEELQAEIVDLKNQLNQKDDEIEKTASLADTIEEKNSEIAMLKNEIEELKQSKQVLIEENQEAVEKCKNDYEEKIRLYDSKFAAIEEKVAVIESGCTKLNETEKLVAKAKADADAIIVNANDAVNNAVAELSDLYNAFKTASVNYDSSSIALKNRVEALFETLNTITINSEAE